jgi:transglutaminase-like putative cysteine protease
MKRRILVLAVALFMPELLLSSQTFGQNVSPPSNLPAKVLVQTRNIDVSADGSWIDTSHIEIQLLQQSAIGALSHPALTYSEQLQQADVAEAYTLKADKTKVPVAPDAIITQQSPMSARSPLLSDLKQKVIIFPNVEVGDTIVYTTITRTRPQFLGSFIYDLVIPPPLPVDDASFTITIPKSLAPNIEQRGIDVQKKVGNDEIVFTLKYANPTPSLRTPPMVSDFDLAPRASVSTFKDYNELAKAYAVLALPMIAVTPQIQQQADQITAGISDRREQAMKIYDWVAAHIRYIALEFGQGGIVPHSAESVLTNAYGDCKDHAVLFAALLKAKGIESNLVLVNALNTYTIAKVATMAPFDHVVTWLPEFQLYADTTNGTNVPFGYLPNSEYGKPVLHIGDASGALHETPLSRAELSTDTYKLVITMDDEGRIQSESSISATGNFATPLRALGSVLQGDNGSKAAAAILEKTRTPDATGALVAQPLSATIAPYQISASYSTPGVNAALANGQDFVFGDNLNLVPAESAAFFGPVFGAGYNNADPVPCYSGHAIADETLNFPATRHLEKLPSDVDISSGSISYLSHWSQTATSVNVHREFDAHFDKALCSGASLQETISVWAKIKQELATSFAVPRT